MGKGLSRFSVEELSNLLDSIFLMIDDPIFFIFLTIHLEKLVGLEPIKMEKILDKKLSIGAKFQKKYAQFREKLSSKKPFLGSGILILLTLGSALESRIKIRPQESYLSYFQGQVGKEKNRNLYDEYLYPGEGDYENPNEDSDEGKGYPGY